MDEAIAAIVVSFNTRALTLRCLETLLAAGDSIAEIVVVDNGSVDGSVEAMEGLSEKVRVIRAGRNLGFGAANNLGMRSTSSRYVALVNSDAFVEPDAMRVLRKHLLSRPQVGVVGPLLLNADGSRQESCFHFPTPGRAWLENSGLLWLGKRIHREPVLSAGRVEWVSGACLMVRREVIEQVGGFDEAFFLYSEETDWQRRIRNAGWSVEWEPAARVVHLGGASGGIASLVVREYFYSGVDRYFLKHHGVPGVMALRGATFFGALLRGILGVFGGGVLRPGGYTLWLLNRQLTHRFPLSATSKQDGGVGQEILKAG